MKYENYMLQYSFDYLQYTQMPIENYICKISKYVKPICMSLNL